MDWQSLGYSSAPSGILRVRELWIVMDGEKNREKERHGWGEVEKEWAADP